MKAIMIVEVPDTTVEGWEVTELDLNKFNIDKESYEYGSFIKGIEYEPGEVILKPMPQKIEVKRYISNGKEYEIPLSEIEVGYNTCIDELLGE